MALGKLYELVDQRYLHCLPTILTANRNLEALSTYWGKTEPMQGLARAIVSRIVGQLAAVIQILGPGLPVWKLVRSKQCLPGRTKTETKSEMWIICCEGSYLV